MTVVQSVARDPSGLPLTNLRVRITLVTGSATLPGYTSDGDIVGSAYATTDENGAWSADLVPNSQITPANTYYRVVEATMVTTLVVPATGGPYALRDASATPPPTPGAPGITGVQVAVGGMVAGVRPEVNLIAGANVTITGADNPAGNRVDVTVDASGAGGSGTVTSVNHIDPDGAGNVTLTAGDVGADALGAAAAAQSAAITAAEANAASIYLPLANVGAAGSGAGNALSADDPTTTDPRTPTAHAVTHASAGTDPVTPAEIGAVATSAVGAANGVASLDANAHLPAAQGANIFSRQIHIAANGLASSVVATVGTWTPTYLRNADTGNFVGWVNASDGAQTDAISFDFACGAGTYSLELYHLPFTNRGIYTVKIDGVAAGTVDGYAASLSPQRAILTGIVLTAGQHTVTVLMASKNASASSYLGMIERMLLTRTA